MKKIAKIGMAALVAAAMAMSFMACNGDVAGGDGDDWDGIQSTNLTSIAFTQWENANADGFWGTQAQPSILDTNHYPVQGDVLNIKLTGTFDNALPNLGAYLAASTDGKTASGTAVSWWYQYCDAIELNADGIAANEEVTLDFNLTLTNDAPGDASTIQYGQEANSLMLVLYASDETKDNVPATTFNVTSCTITNVTQSASAVE